MSSTLQYIVQRGSHVSIPLNITDGPGGPYRDADALPVVTALHKNGSGADEADTTLALTVTQAQDDTPAALKGRYIVSFNSSSLAKGDSLIIYGTAVVNSATLDWIKAIDVIDDPVQRVVIY